MNSKEAYETDYDYVLFSTTLWSKPNFMRPSSIKFDITRIDFDRFISTEYLDPTFMSYLFKRYQSIIVIWEDSKHKEDLLYDKIKIVSNIFNKF